MNDNDEEQLENSHVDFNEVPIHGQDFTAPKGRQESGLAGGSQPSQADQVRDAMGGMRDLAVGLGRALADTTGMRSVDKLSKPAETGFGKFTERRTYVTGVDLSEALADEGMVRVITQTADAGNRVYAIGRPSQELLQQLGPQLANAGEPGKYLLISQGRNSVTGNPEQNARYLGEEDVTGVVAKKGERDLTLNKHAERDRPIQLRGEITDVVSLHGLIAENSDQMQTQTASATVGERPIAAHDVSNALTELALGMTRPTDLGDGDTQVLDSPQTDSFGTFHEKKTYKSGCQIDSVIDDDKGVLFFRTRNPEADRVIEIGRTPREFDPSIPEGTLLPDAGESGAYVMAVTTNYRDRAQASQRKLRYLDAEDIREVKVVHGENIAFQPNLQRGRIIDVPGQVVSSTRMR